MYLNDRKMSTLSQQVLNYCLENASVKSVQSAVRNNNLSGIAYDMKIYLASEFPELRNDDGSIGLKFGIIVSDAFAKFKTDDHVLASDLLRKIDAKRRLVKILGKHHRDYLKHALEHDQLVSISNALQEPINNFLALYKKAQKRKGKNLSVRKPKGK